MERRQMKVTAEHASLIAHNIIAKRWNIKTPPPWFICSVLNLPYVLRDVEQNEIDLAIINRTSRKFFSTHARP